VAGTAAAGQFTDLRGIDAIARTRESLYNSMLSRDRCIESHRRFIRHFL
jgi:hypothetical protein